MLIAPVPGISGWKRDQSPELCWEEPALRQLIPPAAGSESPAANSRENLRMDGALTRCEWLSV